MQCNTRVRTALIGFVVVPVFACGQGKNEKSAAGNVAPPSSTQPYAVPGTSYGAPPASVETAAAKPKHHSKLAGAGAGAVAGHALGHPIAGAVAGAIIQHERNKHNK